MSAILAFANFNEKTVVETTVLAADAHVNDTTISVEGAQGIVSPGQFALIGRDGDERTELRAISAVSSFVLTVAALAQEHKQFSPILILGYDKIQVNRATAPADGSQPLDSAYAAFGDPFVIDYDDETTRYVDDTGGSGYWYKVAYLNSTTAATTALADSEGIRGGDSYTYNSLLNIRNAAGFGRNKNITDIMINDARAWAQSIIDGALSGKYAVPFTHPINPMIADLTKELAAGKLLVEQYGIYSTQDTNNGQTRIDKANAQIEKLKAGQLVLVNVPEAPNADTNLGFSAYPDDITQQGDREGFMFERQSIDGYQGRTY